MHLTIPDVCGQLGVSRSTVLRWLQAHKLTGRKRHACGSLCAEPFTCRQGSWEIDPIESVTAPEQVAG